MDCRDLIPGRDGSKGNKGDRGRRGKKGMMGQPGRSGKQGIMGPPGIRGEKGVKGDIGAPGIPGMKGEPGESISAPKATVSSSQLTVNESDAAVLLCSTSGNPAPTLVWSRIKETLPSNRTKVLSNGVACNLWMPGNTSALRKMFLEETRNLRVLSYKVSLLNR